ncbi:hypothetical protein pb186bvf_011062 [Paramecium bursaria]
MSSFEAKILQSIWILYQKNLISCEQKGSLKDLLIRKDRNLYYLQNCDIDTLVERLLEILYYQGSPREFDHEPVNNSSTPTTILSIPYQKNRIRFKSSQENEIQPQRSGRSFSFYDK